MVPLRKIIGADLGFLDSDPDCYQHISFDAGLPQRLLALVLHQRCDLRAF